MRKIKGFSHFPGVHCGTTALNDLGRFYGQALTEPLCLGIAGGLAFVLMEKDGVSPSRFLGGRDETLERRFFENLEVPFAWQKEQDNARAWAAAKSCIDRGIPVLIRADLHYLAYYHSGTHFTGHAVVLVGYDKARGEAYLADTHFPGLQTVSLPDLEKARTSPFGMAPLENDAFPVSPFGLPSDRGGLFRRTIAGQAKKMLSGRDLGAVKTGIPGMDHLAGSFPAWKDTPDWQWCARFAYQIIEKRGTGGGSFRKLYSEFLSQAAADLPDLDLEKRARQMGEIGDRWSDLASTLKAVSEAATPSGFKEAGRIMGDIADRERAFFTEAAAIAP